MMCRTCRNPAARAGETAMYIWGEESITLNVATNYMRCSNNRDDGNTRQEARYVVGTLSANSWGLFDMRGIGFDLVRGNCPAGKSESNNNLANRTDPFEVVEENGTHMRGKGGPRMWDAYNNACSAASRRAGNDPSGYAKAYNCRVAYIVE